MVSRNLLAGLAAVALVVACSDSNRYEVGVVKPLMVIGVTPGGTEGVSLDSNLIVKFSDPVLEASLNAKTVLLADAEGNAFEIELTWDKAENQVTVDPVKNLPYSTDFTLTLTQKIKREADDAVLAKEVIHTFKTANPPQLTVVSSVPSGGATSIGAFVDDSGNLTPYGDKVSTEIIITFSEGIDRKSVTGKTFTVKRADGVAVTGEITWDSTDEDARDLVDTPIHTDDVLKFKADEPLNLSTEYTITLKASFDDGVLTKRATRDGGWFESDVEWTFRTIDPPPLRVLWTTPSTDAVNVGTLIDPAGLPHAYGNRVSQPVVIRFSEGAATDTVLANLNVYESGATAPIAGTISFASSGPAFWQVNDTVLFEPADWKLSTRYLVVVGKATESFRATAAGGQLGEDFGIDFETVNPPPLRVLWSSPSDGGVNVGTVIPDVYGNAVSKVVYLRFSEGADTASVLGNLTIRDESNNPLVVTTAFTSSGAAFWQQNDTLVLWPASWELARNYTVGVGAAAQSFRATAASGQLGAAHASAFDANDPLPLFLEASFPGNGAEVSRSFISSVAPGTNNGDQVNLALTLYFSEPVDRASLEANLTLSENGIPVVLATPFAYAGGDTAVTVAMPPLLLSADYEVSLSGGSIAAPFVGVTSARGTAVQAWYDVADDTGGYLNGNQSVRFTTPDPAPLIVTAISPTVDALGYADNASRETVVQVTFSEPVAAAIRASIETDGPANVYANLTTAGVTAVPASFSFNAGGDVLTITPGAPLAYSTEHELTLVGGSAGIASWRVTGQAGWLVPAGSTKYTFKTVDPATLTVWATSPSDQALSFGVVVTDVSVEAKIQILFNQAVDDSSFQSNIAIVDCGGTAAGCASGTPIALNGVTYVDYPSGAQKAIVDAGLLPFETYYRITLTGGAAGVRSLENVSACSAACEGGYLPADHVITFKTRGRPPLEVTALEPLNGANGVNITPRIVVEFSTSVSPATLTGYTFYLTDVTNNLLVHRFGDNLGDGLYSSPATAEIVLNGILDFDTEYNLVLLSSITGIDGRFLARDVRLSFHTKLASIVRSTDPSETETGVETDLSLRANAGGITVYFDGPVTTSVGVTPEMAMTITYSTDQGDAVLLGSVDTATPGEWVFIADPTCTAGGNPLDANTTYYLNLSDAIWRANGSANVTGGYRGWFNTETGPEVSGVWSVSDVPANEDLVINLLTGNDEPPHSGRGSSDVPIVSTFKLTFDRPMNQGTVLASAIADTANDTLQIVASDATSANLGSLSWSPDGRSLTFSADDPTNSYVGNDLRFATSYTLKVRKGVKDTTGNSLAQDFVVTFTTSNATSVYFVADGNQKDMKYMPAVTFSSAIIPSTLDDSNFYVTEGTLDCVGGAGGGTFKTMPALLDYGYDGRSAALVPAPIMIGSLCHRVYVRGLAPGPRDVRGNPLPTAIYETYIRSKNLDNTSDTLTLTTVQLAGLGGRAPFRLNVSTNKTESNVLPTSIDPDTFFVYADAALAVPVDGRVYYDFAAGQIVFALRDGAYFNASNNGTGTYYYVANGTLSTALRGNCTAGCTGAAQPFTIEPTPPTATFSPLNGAVGVSPDVSVVITFSEPIRSETAINGINNLSVRDAGVPVPGSWSLGTNDTVATFTPDQAFVGGTTYTIGVGTSVLDYAGNAYVPGVDPTFTITTTGPQVVSSVPANGDLGVALASDITVTFDKSVAPATVLTSLWGGGTTVLPGSIRVNATTSPTDLWLTDNAATEVWACASVNDNVVTFSPLYDFSALTGYSLGVTTSITDLGGNALQAPYAAAFTTP